MIKFISKVGTNRGKSRIWLEGARLTKAGFTWQTKYQLAIGKDSINLTLGLEDNRKVAGRMRNDKAIPIIDLCSNEITGFCQGCEQVEVTVNNGHILINRKGEA